MRLIVFFDLPVETALDKKEYRKFRRFLVKNGFIMLQESVYSKLVLNGTVQKSVTDLVKNNKPKNGIVSLLTVTEKQYASIVYITGEFHTDIVDSDKRVVVI